VPAIVAMLADDPLGQTRETPDHPGYIAAFEALNADTNQFLAVLEVQTTEAAGAEVSRAQLIGTLQLTFIPGLSHTGMWRGQIESVRIADKYRGCGYGHALFTWAITQCQARGCGMVQLTTHSSRTSAHRFYADLGFEASHLGYKLTLQSPHS
jgi:GNAT superfamily N-acetyltransferase